MNFLCRMGFHRLQRVATIALMEEVEESVGSVTRITTKTTWTYDEVRACGRCPFETAPIITDDLAPLRPEDFERLP